MLAFIEHRRSLQGGHSVRVVSEQDYHERGAFAYSYDAKADTAEEAESHARVWAARNGMEIVSIDEVAA
jgi:hypothetical protein